MTATQQEASEMKQVELALRAEAQATQRALNAQQRTLEQIASHLKLIAFVAALWVVLSLVGALAWLAVAIG